MTEMQRQLSAVPAARRRRAAAALGLSAALLAVIGILPWTAPAPTAVHVIAVAALLAAVLAGSIAWGLARSITLDTHRARAAELDAILAAAGGCDCGHDHDHDHGADPHDHSVAAPGHPAEAACPSDGHGTDCAHNCDACVLSQLR